MAAFSFRAFDSVGGEDSAHTITHRLAGGVAEVLQS